MREPETPSRLLCLAFVVFVASLLSFVDPVTVSADIAAPVPGALWTVPMPTAGSPVVTPTGNVLAGPCTNVNRNGVVVWGLIDNLETSASCATVIGDSQGNSYIQTTDSTGPIVESINSSGGVRWTMPMGSFGPGRVGAGPAIGSNGSAYFSKSDGLTSKVVGFDEQTGAATFNQSFGDVTGLYAYAGGIIVVNTDSEVDYFSYDGTLQNTYHTSPAISAYEAYSNAGGANGTVFLAGYPGSCGGDVSVAKFAPTGLVWMWTDTTPHNCSQTLLAATPDGGVILARSEAASGLSADFRSISPAGAFRWDHHANGPLGPAYGGGYFHPIIDVNGLVALPSLFDVTCTNGSPGPCKGAQVEFVSQKTDSSTLPTLLVADPANDGFDLYNLAIDSERVYLSRENQGAAVPPSLSAFAVSGLGVDYRLALQETLMPGSGPTPPSDGAGGSGGTTGTSSGGSSSSGGNTTPAPPTNPCAPVHGSIGKRLLASLKCTAIQSKLEGECAATVASIILPQLRSIKALRTTKGLYDLRKVKTSLRPLAKLFNDLKTFKFGPKTPAGFKTGADVIKKLKAAHTAYGILKLLPDLIKALSSADFSEIALDLDKYFQLTPCVQAVANALD